MALSTRPHGHMTRWGCCRGCGGCEGGGEGGRDVAVAPAVVANGRGVRDNCACVRACVVPLLAC